jgi:hypothetical protein
MRLDDTQVRRSGDEMLDAIAARFMVRCRFGADPDPGAGIGHRVRLGSGAGQLHDMPDGPTDLSVARVRKGAGEPVARSARSDFDPAANSETRSLIVAAEHLD